MECSFWVRYFVVCRGYFGMGKIYVFVFSEFTLRRERVGIE